MMKYMKFLNHFVKKGKALFYLIYQNVISEQQQLNMNLTPDKVIKILMFITYTRSNNQFGPSKISYGISF